MRTPWHALISQKVTRPTAEAEEIVLAFLESSIANRPAKMAQAAGSGSMVYMPLKRLWPIQTGG